MNNQFLVARQTLLTFLDDAIDRVILEPRFSTEDHRDNSELLSDLRTARDKVLTLIIVADLV